jgi:hypothetical protein
MLSQLLSCPQAILAVVLGSAVLAPAAGIAQSTAPRSTAVPGNSSPYAAQQIVIPRAAAAPTHKTPAAMPHPAPALVKQPPAALHPAPAPHPAPARTQAPASPHSAATRKPSLIRQAAHGRIIEEQTPQHLSGAAVRQVSYQCDCADCSGAPMYGDVHCGAEPDCGFAGGCGIAGCHDPACGFEVGCSVEAACGIEAMGCGGYGCDVGCCGDCVDFRLPVFRIDWRRFEFFAGVNAFTGPANYATDASGRRGGSGSFGFYEGVNAGRSLNRLFGLDLASQFGIRATQTNLSGAEFTEEARKQIFLTGGLFRRVDFGLQYGLVVDYLYDDWWYRNNLVQLRGELSWNDACGHEFGYQFMAGTKDSSSVTRLIGAGNVTSTGRATFEPVDQHRLFLRGNTGGGGSYMAFAGGTDRGDGLLGISMLSALRNCFAVEGGVTYLIPAESNRAGGYANEAWNLSMGIVYRPGGKAGCGRYSRPMFNVADNGTFIVDRR